MFSGFTSWIGKAVEETKQQYALDEKYNEDNKGDGEGTDAAKQIAPWNAIPAEAEFADFWGSHPKEWRVLIQGITRDENTFLIPPGRLLEADGIRESLQAVEPKLATSMPEPLTKDKLADAVSVEACLTNNDEMNKLRFAIVPRLVSEDNFWINFLWRVAVFARCTSLDAAGDVLRIINSEVLPVPAEKGAPRKKNVGNWDNGPLLAELAMNVLDESKSQEWARTKQETVSAELSSGKSNAQMLLSLVSGGEGSDGIELADSVGESCKYHKTKIAALIGELDLTPKDKVAETPLCPPDGRLYLELIEVNGQLQESLAAYTAFRERATRQQGSSGSPPSVTTASASPATGGPRGSTHLARAESSASPKSDGRDENAFSADLPWDDDE